MAKKLSRTKQILCAIGETLRDQGDQWLGFLVGTMDPRYHRLFYGGGAAAVSRQLHREAIREHMALLRRLKEQKCIQMQRVGDRIRLTLTEKGKRIAMKEQMRNAAACKKNECVIAIFDIPEREESARKQFRSLLKECGFQQLQRSVWISRCDVLVALQDFIRSTGRDQWIRVFRALD